MILTTALPKSKHALVLPLAATSLQAILQVLKETKAKKIYLKSLIKKLKVKAIC